LKHIFYLQQHANLRAPSKMYVRAHMLTA